jgi:hypothetical protein
MNKLTKIIGATTAAGIILFSAVGTAYARPMHPPHRDHRDGGAAAAAAAAVITALILEGQHRHPHDRVRPWDRPSCRQLRNACEDGYSRACRKFRYECAYRR